MVEAMTSQPASDNTRISSTCIALLDTGPKVINLKRARSFIIMEFPDWVQIKPRL